MTCHKEWTYNGNVTRSVLTNAFIHMAMNIGGHFSGGSV